MTSGMPASELSSRISHREEGSEISSVVDSNDEKASCTPTVVHASAMNTIYTDRSYLSSASYLLGTSQAPNSPTGLGPFRGSQMDPRRISRRSYMEDYPDFDAQLEEELHHNDEDDDDDDNLGGSTSRRKNMKVFGCSLLSIRGILNVGALILLVAALITVFGVLPIISFFQTHRETEQIVVNSGGFN